MKSEEKNLILGLGQSVIGCGGVIVAAIVTGLCSVVVALNAHASIGLPQIFSSTPVVIVTATPSPVAQATTPRPTVAGPSNWPLVLAEPFNSNANSWLLSPTEPYTDDYGRFNESIEGGKLNVEGTAAKPVVSKYGPSVRAVSDLYLTAEAKEVNGPATAHYGLFFHNDNEGNYYLFKIEDQREFAVSMWDQGQWTNLIGWTPSNAIHPGGLNQLTVVAQGPHYTFWINGQQVDEMNDATLPSGQSGVAFELDTGQQALFAFADFELRTP